MTDTDDDVEDYLDPELDPTPTESDGWFPSLFSVGGLVVGLHFLAAGAILPAAWSALQSGAHAQAGFYSMLSALMIAAGFVVGRIANRRVD
ncbi:hypothetical protein [Salinibaculum rarum]|uniref:hypothetical protein n=1 Tax=Salinibaculum rarum TaxID=3058903 RepID=UPI00265F2675|nr:hypothetical protein [Salinibaculum sp. KK48]